MWVMDTACVGCVDGIDQQAARDVDRELADLTKRRMGRTSIGRALLQHNPEVFEQLERQRSRSKWAVPGAVLGDRSRSKYIVKRKKS